MAIERRYSARLKADVYRVRYPDARRPGHWLSATFDNYDDAATFDAQWRVKQRHGVPLSVFDRRSYKSLERVSAAATSGPSSGCFA